MQTLLLDSGYTPIDQVSWQRAITLLWQGKAEVVEEYADWSVRSATVEWRVPAVLRLVAGKIKRKRGIRFSRENVYARDKGRCGYCDRKIARAEATYDHVVPRHQGGLTKWENVVICCVGCNQRKRNRTPEQAGMILRVKPHKPTHLPESLRLSFTKETVPKEWAAYLRDVIYWHGEIDQD